MRLTIIAPDNVYEHEVDPSMEVQDVQALIEAETGLPASNLVLSNDNGVQLNDAKKSLASYDLSGQAGTIFLTFKNQAAASTSSAGPSSSSMFPNTDADLERMRLQALGDPNLMSELRLRDPEMAAAIQSGTRFKEIFQNHQRRLRDAASEKERQIEALNADPYDIDAQKKIEEAIRMEAVMENWNHAVEYSPEAFGNVTMLYINVEVNGHPIKAFVDSGAQSTIISPDCAEACGIMRLLDKRFEGMAMGVGTAKILGRIHSAQIKLGNLFLPCSFSVLEGRSVDLLFGLDMLKRHQCCIDLANNVLRIGTTEIPFLAEHELPEKAQRVGEQAMADEMGEASSLGIPAGLPDPRTVSGFPGSGQALGSSSGPGAAAGSGPSGSKPRNTPGGPGAVSISGGGGSSTAAEGQMTGKSFPDADIQTLMNLGAPRDQAISLLEATGGNVDVAASMLFGGDF